MIRFNSQIDGIIIHINKSVYYNRNLFYEYKYSATV